MRMGNAARIKSETIDTTDVDYILASRDLDWSPCRKGKSERLTSLSEDDGSQLAVAKAASGFIFFIPSFGKDRSTLNDPQESHDDITDDQGGNKSLEGSDKGLADGDPEKEQANGDLGKHQSRECLDPFPV